MASYASHPGANQADYMAGYCNTAHRTLYSSLTLTLESREQCLPTEGLCEPIKSAQLPQKPQQRQETDQRCVLAIESMSEPSANYCTDGQPPKRRGPKPDSKPALTRRQELNRQAQRFVHPSSLVPGI